jgi:perosamine synthetase
VHFIPVHHLPYFRGLLGRPSLPAADRVFPRLLSLPLHPRLLDADVDRVCALIAELGGGRSK